MTDIQNRLMQLTDELSSICQENGLRFILSDQTARHAQLTDGFEGDACLFHVMMPLEDVLTLRSLVNDKNDNDLQKKLKHRRYVESWYDGGETYNLEFRYVDLDSLLIDASIGSYYKYCGIALSIYPLIQAKIPRKLQDTMMYRYRVLRAGETGKDLDHIMTTARFRKRLLGGKSFDKMLEKKEATWLKPLLENCQDAVKLRQEKGNDGLSASILRDLAALKVDDSLPFSFFSFKGRWVKFPADLFTNTEKVTFEVRVLPVTSIPDYYRTIFGKNWDRLSRRPLPGSERNRVMWNLDVTCEEFMEADAQTESTMKDCILNRREYNTWKKAVHTPVEKAVEQTFAQIKRSVDRIDIWYSLQDKREDLRKADEEGDLDTMRSILKRYLSRTDQLYELKAGMYIDDEIFGYAKKIWEADGRSDFADKVYALVPEIYKTETVEDFLESVGWDIAQTKEEY